MIKFGNEKLDETIKKILKNKHTELSIGIIYQDKIKIIEETNSTCPYYDIGSLSKVITSLIILKMVSEKLIDMDMKVDKILSLKEGEYPTISSLLNHQLSYWYLVPLNITLPGLLKRYGKVNVYQEVTSKKVIKAIERIQNRGNKYTYSDFSYAILAMVIEKIYHKSYVQVLDEFMKNEFSLNIKASLEDVERKKSYIGSKEVKNWIWHDGNPYIASGGLSSTINDLTSLVDMLINRNDDYINMAFDINALDEKHNNTFFLSKNHHVYYHVGGVGTFRSSLSINRKRRIGVIILSSTKGYRKANVSYLNKMIYNYLRRNKFDIDSL